MDRVEHELRVGEAGCIELMAAPLVLGPIVPVLHYVVDGYLSLAELSECAEHFILCLVALSALPEAEHPLGIDGSLACQGAVA